MEYLASLDILKSQIIKVDKSSFDIKKNGFNNEKAISKLIRISLLTPNLGDGIRSIEELNESDLAWSTLPSGEEETDSYQIIYDYQILSPWKLIRKN